jgi:hypothetical protein
MAAFKVDDGEPPHAESEVFVCVKSVIVWAAVRDATRHLADVLLELAYLLVSDAGYAAHIIVCLR